VIVPGKFRHQQHDSGHSATAENAQRWHHVTYSSAGITGTAAARCWSRYTLLETPVRQTCLMEPQQPADMSHVAVTQQFVTDRGLKLRPQQCSLYRVHPIYCVPSNNNHGTLPAYTGRFVMFYVITNIYTKNTERPMELFAAIWKLEIFFMTTLDVRRVHRGWHGTRRHDIQVLATRVSTWVHRYSSLLQWSVALGQRGHVAMVGRILCMKCTFHSDHRLNVWYSNTQNDFTPGAAIFSLHILASPSGRDVKKLTKGENFWVVPSICTGLLNTCPTVSL
jgi:hypothetical protein